MKVPLEWLKTYTTVRLLPKALAERLTMAGLEVVAIHDVDGEPVLDLEITPNRADCLSIIGVAREVAAMTEQRLTLPSAQGSGLRAPRPASCQSRGGQGKSRKPTTPSPEPPAKLSIRIEDRKGCRRYIGRLMEGVTIAPSPEWMQRRLIACGARPINNVVDITNYVLLEYGQPLHAFDYDRLAQGTIVVRRARANEPITTLDGIRRALPAETLVIADAARAVAVAGIMGGTGSEVAPGTRRVLLESALFDPVTVRRTARSLGLASDSSYRFERGVDPAGVAAASLRAASLISELAGGRDASMVDVGAKPATRKAIALEPQRLSRWLGMPLSAPAIRTGLARLSCRVISSDGASAIRVIPPSFRQDLTQAADLYEEVARVVGYDRLPSRSPASRAAVGSSEESLAYWRHQSLRCLCASLGLTEAITWSLISEAELARCRVPASRAARLANPLSRDHAYLRPSLLPGLLQAVRRNLTQGAEGVRFYEVGSVVRLASLAHHSPERSRVGVVPPEERAESQHVGIAIAGVWRRDWRGKQIGDFFLLKGVLETLAARLCDGAFSVTPQAVPWAEPNRGTAVQVGGRVVGAAGQVARAATQALDIDEDVWYAELSVAELLQAKRSIKTIAAPSALPSVKRDISILLSSDTPFAEVARAIRETGSPMAGRVELIDRYTGPQIPAGKCSLTFAIEYRIPARTLTADEVDAIHQRIGQALTDRFQARLR